MLSNIVSKTSIVGEKMNYIVAGTILFFVGLGLLIVSVIPIPKVEYVPESTPVMSPTYTTIRKTWLDEKFVLSPGVVKYYCGKFPSNTQLTIYVHVLSGGNRDINFWVVDEDEVTRLVNKETFYYYTAPSRHKVTEATITWKPPSNRKICFVYDNSFSVVTSKTVYTKIEASYETYTVITTYTTVYKQEVKPYTLSFLTIPGIILLIVGVGIALGGSIAKRKVEVRV